MTPVHEMRRPDAWRDRPELAFHSTVQSSGEIQRYVVHRNNVAVLFDEARPISQMRESAIHARFTHVSECSQRSASCDVGYAATK